jgi:hypothetical protein
MAWICPTDEYREHQVGRVCSRICPMLCAGRSRASQQDGWKILMLEKKERRKNRNWLLK